MKEYDFYIVPTPIGNLQDITLRALEILKFVDLIACEDMRETQKLLNHYDIKTKCISYHKFNEKERVNFFLSLLKDGYKIALVSDAGTPLFCDPGSVIVDELRKNNFSITSLAGANACATLLSQVSRDGEDFFFTGFLPRNSEKIQELAKKYKSTDIVFYESPNRLISSLEDIKSCRPNANIAVGRELTKIFEEVVVKNVSEVIEYFKTNTLKGEIAGIILREKNIEKDFDFEGKIFALKSKGYGAKDISTILSSLFEINKNEIYKRCI